MKTTFIQSLLLASSGVEAVYHASKERFHKRYDMSPAPYYQEFELGPPVYFDAEFQMSFKPSLSNVDSLGESQLQIIQELECKSCQTFAYTASTFMKYNKPWLVAIGNVFCDVFIPFFGYQRQACPGIIEDQWTESILPMVQDEILDRQNFCTFIFNVCDTDKWQQIDLDAWIQDLLKQKPQQALSNDIVNKQYESMVPKDKKDLIKLALISDLHMDWDYTPGMSNVCGRPVCCRGDSGLPTSPERTAGKWGDYQCDPPARTVKHLLDHISNEIKPDAVLWGGDSVPHNLDSLDMVKNVQIMQNTTKLISDGLEGYNVFPTMGNHDTYPQDQITVGGKGFEEAIKQWVPSWVQFVDDEENKKTWLNYGYFAKQLNNKTRIISLNSNICYTADFAGWTSFSDPGNQFEWLIGQLTELEEQNAYAIIIAHVPNLDECTKQYARRYHAIADRFQHVIRFGMFSHVHSELYQVMSDVNSGKSIGVNFVVGSVTTFKGKSPNFDLLYLDPDTMLPVDLETYTFDLESANANDTPSWNLYMNVRDEYKMKDMSPESFKNLSKQILTDNEVCTKYKYNSRMGGIKQPPVPCTMDELAYFGCQSGSSDSEDLYKCKYGESFWTSFKFDADHLLVPTINSMNHHWYKPI